MNPNPNIRALAVLVAIALGGCQKNAVEDPSAVEEGPTSAVEVERPPASTVEYHRDEDRGPRVYVPLNSAPCQRDETANVTYLAEALWKYDADSDEWTRVEFGKADNWRLTCNAMADLADIIGLDLETGTYAIVAKVDGRRERGFILEGPMTCNDEDLGAAPAGKIALCVMSEKSADMRFVPDPSTLEP